MLRLRGLLVAFSERCEQAGVAHDLGYFLSKPGALPRTPHLLLIGGGGLRDIDPDSLLGAVLIFEQKVAGIGLGAYATNDRSGRGTVIARAADRARVAGTAAAWLMQRGAHLVLMSFRGDDSGQTAGALAAPLSELSNRGGICWAWREREIPAYLPLPPTLDEALATLGTRTRRNLRYYRRRLESELGGILVPQAAISRKELLAFNRECMYAVSPRAAGWRYDSLKELDQPIFMGLKDKEGRWLSLLGGRRYLDRSELLWQMNRTGMREYSLGTAMRSYLLEYEIAHGAKRLYAEGGTSHTMVHSFVQEQTTDLIVRRNTLAARAMRAVAQRYIAPDNELSRMLQSSDLEWRSC